MAKPPPKRISTTPSVRGINTLWRCALHNFLQDLSFAFLSVSAVSKPICSVKARLTLTVSYPKYTDIKQRVR